MTREEQLLETLALRNATLQNISRTLDAYRMKFFGGIGSGVDCSQFELVIVCRKCGCPASPIDHACEGIVPCLPVACDEE